MSKLNLEVDFSAVKDKQDIILRLSSVLGLHDISGYSWDSFYDYFINLDPDSEVVRNTDPKPQKVHLVVKNVKDVRKVSEKDYNILLSILQDATKKENKDIEDKIEFSYEIVQ